MSKNSVFTAQFFRMKKSVSIDGLIGCIEKAKEECINSIFDDETVIFFNEETDEMLSYVLDFKRNLTNQFTMYDIGEKAKYFQNLA